MILLTSDGLTSPQILNAVKNNMKLLTGRAALVTTASDAREKDDNVPILTEQMRQLGLHAFCVDLEFDDPAILLSCDVVILMGGNPFTLLRHMRKWPRIERIVEELADHHVLAGISAGSMVLGTDIGFCTAITPEMKGELDPCDGFGLVDCSIMPHYVAYQTVYPGMDESLEQCRRKGLHIHIINDGEAVQCVGRGKPCLYLEDRSYHPVISKAIEDARIDAVLFDLYGTLIDIYTREGKDTLWRNLSLFFSYQGAMYEPEELHRALDEAAAEEDMRLGAQTMLPELRMEHVFQKMYQKKNINPSWELIKYTSQMFRACSTEYIRLYHGTKELLELIRKSGKKLYVMSNAQRLFTEYELKMLGIYDAFDGIFLSSDVGCKKPSRYFYRQVLGKIPAKKDNILLVGNNAASDIVPAARLGLHTCYIQSNLSPKLEEQPECDIYLGRMNLPALSEYLSSRKDFRPSAFSVI